MSIVKRVQLAAVFLIVAMLVAGTSAQAGGGYRVDLTSTGVEPGASGEASLYHIVQIGKWVLDAYKADLTVRCEGLSPGTTYYVSSWTYNNGPVLVGQGALTPTKRGTRQVTFEEIMFWGGDIEVTVTNADGAVVLTGQY